MASGRHHGFLSFPDERSEGPLIVTPLPQLEFRSPNRYGIAPLSKHLNLCVLGSTTLHKKNQVLRPSARKSVFDYLKEQGIAAERMSHGGTVRRTGGDNGRRGTLHGNRRVELTFARPIEPTPGGSQPRRPARSGKGRPRRLPRRGRRLSLSLISDPRRGAKAARLSFRADNRVCGGSSSFFRRVLRDGRRSGSDGDPERHADSFRTRTGSARRTPRRRRAPVTRISGRDVDCGEESSGRKEAPTEREQRRFPSNEEIARVLP